MDINNTDITPIIEAVYSSLTNTEKIIADYFLSNNGSLSSKEVSNKLHVSEASLTRFAKKCGYSGFRELTFVHRNEEKKKSMVNDELTRQVLSDYEEILEKSYNLVDEASLNNIITMLNHSKQVYIYGKGSSGLVANEMKLRFMRLGLRCQAITDEHIIRMNEPLLDENCLVIGVSVSGKTEIVINSMREAKLRKASTVLLTANNNPVFSEFVDEVVLVAVKNNMNQGKIISPQFPILIIIDIFYAHYLNNQRDKRENIFQSTLSAFEDNESK